MLHSECSFLSDKSVPWDTGCARRLLPISDDERKILDNMPGWPAKWSVKDIDKSENTFTEGEKSLPLLEKPPNQPLVTDTESINKSVTILNSDNLTKVSAQNCNLPLKENSSIALSENKHSFMQSLQLVEEPLTQPQVTDTESINVQSVNILNSDNLIKVSAQNCNLPLKENALSENKHSFMQSLQLVEEPLTQPQVTNTKSINIRSCNTDNLSKASADNDNPPLKENSSIALSENISSFVQSITFYANKVAGMFSGNPRGRSYSLSDVRHAKFEEGVTFSKSETNLEDKTFDKRTCKTLDAHILNHPFLKMPESKSLGFSTDGSANHKDLLNKRTELLEKKFYFSRENGLHSPNKESSTSQIDLGTSVNKVNFATSQIDSGTSVSKVNFATSKVNLALTDEPEFVSQPGASLPDLVCNNNLNSSHVILHGTNSSLQPEETYKLCAAINETVKLHNLSPDSSEFENDSEINQTDPSYNENIIISFTNQDEESLPSIASVLATKTQEDQIRATQKKNMVGLNSSVEISVSQNCEMSETRYSESCGITTAGSSALQRYETNISIAKSKPIPDPKSEYFSGAIEADSKNVCSLPKSSSDQVQAKNSELCKLGGKRKRLSKDNCKPSKKSSLKNSIARIQYTVDEVKNMIQLMKKFQSEK